MPLSHHHEHLPRRRRPPETPLRTTINPTFIHPHEPSATVTQPSPYPTRLHAPPPHAAHYPTFLAHFLDGQTSSEYHQLQSQPFTLPGSRTPPTTTTTSNMNNSIHDHHHPQNVIGATH
ncbi:hypothetical protein RND81_10G237800 [Saponaria officinalis]|uniref:Uncharacterized protein n=1 Tax=Saponaria officinalis TaxID=3572 RepID=A0AAW1I5M2_SAPOF